jgi:DNA polymerase-3 subunit alpha
MFGAITFYKAAKEAGRPGHPRLRARRRSARRARTSHHLPLLAATTRGTRTSSGSSRAVTSCPTSGGRPGVRSREDDVASHAKGLVAMTGCMGGLVAQAILEEGARRGRATLAR